MEGGGESGPYWWRTVSSEVGGGGRGESDIDCLAQGRNSNHHPQKKIVHEDGAVPAAGGSARRRGLLFTFFKTGGEQRRRADQNFLLLVETNSPVAVPKNTRNKTFYAALSQSNKFEDIDQSVLVSQLTARFGCHF